MTQQEVLFTLLEMRNAGIAVPIRAGVTATMTDLLAATIQRRCARAVAIAISGQSFADDGIEPPIMPGPSRPPPPSTGTAS